MGGSRTSREPPIFYIPALLFLLPRTRVLFLTTAPLCPRYGKGVPSGGTFHDILNADIPIHLI
jgi:hypothetical protein